MKTKETEKRQGRNKLQEGKKFNYLRHDFQQILKTIQISIS